MAAVSGPDSEIANIQVSIIPFWDFGATESIVGTTYFWWRIASATNGRAGTGASPYGRLWGHIAFPRDQCGAEGGGDVWVARRQVVLLAQVVVEVEQSLGVGLD